MCTEVSSCLEYHARSSERRVNALTLCGVACVAEGVPDVGDETHAEPEITAQTHPVLMK